MSGLQIVKQLDRQSEDHEEVPSQLFGEYKEEMMATINRIQLAQIKFKQDSKVRLMERRFLPSEERFTLKIVNHFNGYEIVTL